MCINCLAIYEWQSHYSVFGDTMKEYRKFMINRLKKLKP